MEHPSPRSFLAGRRRGFLVVVSKGAPAWCDHRAHQASNIRKVPNLKHQLSSGSSSGIAAAVTRLLTCSRSRGHPGSTTREISRQVAAAATIAHRSSACEGAADLYLFLISRRLTPAATRTREAVWAGLLVQAPDASRTVSKTAASNLPRMATMSDSRVELRRYSASLAPAQPDSSALDSRRYKSRSWRTRLGGAPPRAVRDRAAGAEGESCSRRREPAADLFRADPIDSEDQPQPHCRGYHCHGYYAPLFLLPPASD